MDSFYLTLPCRRNNYTNPVDKPGNFITNLPRSFGIKKRSNKELDSFKSRIDRNNVIDDINYSFNGDKQQIYASALEPIFDD